MPPRAAARFIIPIESSSCTPLRERSSRIVSMAAAITPWSYPERSDDIAVITTSSRSSSIECSPLSPRSERWCGRSPRSERWCGRARGSSASSGSSCVAAGSSAIAEPSTSRSPTEFSPVSPRSERWWSGMPRGGGDPFASSCSRCVAAGSSTVAEPSSLRLSSRSSSMEFSPVLPRSERWCVLRGGVEPTGGTLAFSCCVAAGSSTICRGARRLALSETRRWTGCQRLVVGRVLTGVH
mmetsp:Transcript_9823/g.23651  ORF Transcript_9823/g.23651 Transcript_9823/m.23651 type:complete len:239 (+) Transcript_9823:81-797(+)